MKWYFTAFIFMQNFIFNKIEAFDNLADMGTAKQSGIFQGFNAAKALDGNINQSWYGGSCSHTPLGRTTAWWRLDIGQQANIHNIVIYYRNETQARLDGFYIYISDTFNERHPDRGHMCFHDQPDGYANTLQNITCDYHGRYVVIYNQRNMPEAFLELCEVEVYGCILGRYGNACTYSCSTHCNGTTCDIKTGHCACAPGYRGQKCMKTCDKDTFGEECRSSCHCLNAASCNNVNGQCPRGECASGWKSDTCSEACSRGKYGRNCWDTCSNCKHQMCNPVTGVCKEGCIPGWKSGKCNQECNQGTFGAECKSRCHCVNGVGCNNVNGQCPRGGCDSGWKLRTCSQMCDQGTFGEECKSRCHCLNGVRCNNVNGQCPRGDCDAGWQTITCSEFPPQTPANLSLVSTTETSILVEWTPGYSGDHEHTFYLEYRARRTETWSLKEICHNTKQLTTLTYVLSGLQDSTLYELRMYSKNVFGRSLSTDTDIIQTREKQDKETSSSGIYAVIGGMAGAMTVLIITVIILGTLLFKIIKGWSGGTRNEISNRSDNNDEMSSLNRKTNDMYEDIREGTSDTRNEDLQQRGGNTSTVTYEILAMQDIPNTSGGLSSEQEQRQSESTTEQYETLGEQDKTNVYEEIKNKQEPEDRSLSTLS